ncbi:putative RNA-directed DNA polymerase [Arabidopsis thaliana]
MSEERFVRSVHDPCVYVKLIGAENHVYLLLYVDDMLIAAKDMSEVNKLKKTLSEEFEMKDLGAASKILGIEFTRDMKQGVLCLSQSGYLGKILQRFNMSGCKATNTPIGTHFKLSSVRDMSECINTEKTPYASAVGSVMYSMIGTRPDLAYALGLVSRFMSKPGSMHWEAVKWLLRYIKGSQELCLVYTKGKNLNIMGYCDSDHGGDLDKQRSVSGYIFTVGDNIVSWKSCLTIDFY